MLATSKGMTYCMVKGHSIDDHELPEVILVGIVVAMPGNHIIWGVALRKQERHALWHSPPPHPHSPA